MKPIERTITLNTREWTEEEVYLLKELYPKTPTKDIANRLNRSLFSINNKATYLGLFKNPEYKTQSYSANTRKANEARKRAA
jgi:hypothetical protein